MDIPAISGFGHVDLTVVDCERTVDWWERVLGFKLIASRDAPDFKLRSVIHPCGYYIGFVTHTNPVTDRFDERAVGLDHLALLVPDIESLEAWAKRLDDLGIPHSGIQDEIGGPLIVFRDPDNIQLELHAFGAAPATPGTHNTAWHQ